MNSLKERTITIALLLLGVLIVPILFIWKADNLFVLTIKTFLAAFFLLLLIRTVTDKGQKSGSDEPSERDF
jgi:hypothetical protein